MTFKKILVLVIGPWSILSCFSLNAMHRTCLGYLSLGLSQHAIPNYKKAKQYWTSPKRRKQEPSPQMETHQEALDHEDAQAAQLIDKVMNGEKKIAELQEEVAKFKALEFYFPDFYKTIKSYKHSFYNLRTFPKNLKILSENNQLPPKFKENFDKHNERMAKMSWGEWLSYIHSLYQKIS